VRFLKHTARFLDSDGVPDNESPASTPPVGPANVFCLGKFGDALRGVTCLCPPSIARIEPRYLLVQSNL
jgi:hypothetical protein